MVEEQFLAGWELYAGIGIAIFIAVVVLAMGLKTIRPTHVGAIETFGKYTGYKTDGLTFVFPFVQALRAVNVTERLVDVEKQDVITKENLNCKIDAQVYYKIHKTEEDMKSALYNVNDVSYQIVELAQSTLRAVIGKKMFKDVNADRQELNKLIYGELTDQTKNWGVKIVRVELKEIFPPSDVQETMNEIIKAENEKDRQADLAKALVIETEGKKDAMIVRAEGEKAKQILDSEAVKQKQIIEAEGEKEQIVLQSEAKKQEYELVAQGEAEAIKLVADANAHQYEVENDALTQHFKGTAVDYKKLETTVESLKNNSKFLIADKNQALTLILDETKGGKDIIPVEGKKGTKVSKTFNPSPEHTTIQ